MYIAQLEKLGVIAKYVLWYEKLLLTDVVVKPPSFLSFYWNFHLCTFHSSQLAQCQTAFLSRQPKFISPRPPHQGDCPWLVQLRCPSTNPGQNCGNFPNLVTPLFLRHRELRHQSQQCPPPLPWKGYYVKTVFKGP